MRLNVSDIPDDGIQQEIDLLISINDSQEPDLAEVFIKILKIGKKVLVEGSVKISVSLNCSRCLEDFPYPLDISFWEEYNPAEDRETEGEKELSGSELDLSYYSNNEIDISELIKEQVLLSVPMKALCGPECGKNYNKGPCECSTEEVDPRLAPLKKFRESMKNRKE